MDVAVVQQFVTFFQDFVDICQWKNWPNNDTTEVELKNAFLLSNHVEKCLAKFKTNNMVDELLCALNIENESSSSLTNCLSSPTKYILKKIINANTKISQMDIAFKIFLQLFPEEKLEDYLTELIVEASSKEVLLSNLSVEISKDELLVFQSKLFLSQVTEDSKQSLQELLLNCEQDFIHIIVISIGLTTPTYSNSIKIVSESMLNVLKSKNNTLKNFWKCLFNINHKYLIQMCVKNGELYDYICEALIDCSKLINENMSAEYFYIDFTKLELENIMKLLFQDVYLKSHFINIVNNHGIDVIDFWQQLM